MELNKKKRNTERAKVLLTYPKPVLIEAMLDLIRKALQDEFKGRLGKERIELAKKYKYEIEYFSDDEVLNSTIKILDIYLKDFQANIIKDEKGIH